MAAEFEVRQSDEGLGGLEPEPDTDDEADGAAEGLVDLRVYAASVAVGFMMSSNSTGVSFPSRR